MTRLVPVIASLVALAVPAAAAAAPGEPDRSFGRRGVASAPFPGGGVDPGGLLVRGGRPTAFGAVPGDTPDSAFLFDTIAASFDRSGRRDSGFQLPTVNGLSDQVGDVVREPGGRIVVALYHSPPIPLQFGPSSSGISLVGLTASGAVDPTFGAGGRVSVPGAADMGRLLRARDGSLRLLATGVRPLDLEPGAPYAGPLGVMLVRYTADGRFLGLTTLSRSAHIGGAVELGDGSSLAAGTGDGAGESLVLTRFRPDGTPDPAFGAEGVRDLPLGRVRVEDATLGADGRMLVAGARRDGSRWGPMLLRLTPDGRLDPGLPAVDPEPGAEVAGLTGVRTDGDGRILVADDQGRIARLTPAGRPDLGFGLAGLSPAPPARLRQPTGLTLSGAGAYLTAELRSPDRLAVERVAVDGPGLLRPRAGRRVRLLRRAGRVTLTVPLSSRPLRLRRRTAVGLATSAGNATVARATHGALRVVGASGRADVRHGAVALGRAGRRVAALGLRVADCRAASATTFRLRGRFLVRAGPTRLRNTTRRAAFMVRPRCARPPVIRILRGQVRRTGP